MRAAISAANASTTDDTIRLIPTDTYYLSKICGGEEDSNACGDLDISKTIGSLIIQGDASGLSTISAKTSAGGTATERVLEIRNANVTLEKITVRDGSAEGGGGIYAYQASVTLTDSAILANTSTDDGGGGGGGGIYCSGTLTLNNTLVSGNTSEWSGGGIMANGTLTLNNSTVSENKAPYVYYNLPKGGGIYAIGTITLNGSTVSNNSTDYSGGGIYSDTNSNITLTNSTVSNNSAGGGGGIAAFVDTLRLYNSTVSHNMAEFAGGLYALSSEDFTLSNSVLANSYNSQGQPIADCEAASTSSSDSWIEDAGSCTGLASSGDPLLGELADNGGAVQTHMPLFGSPLIDAAADCNDLSDDARGVTRPQDGNNDGIVLCDIGAVEKQLSSISLTSPQSGRVYRAGATITLSASVNEADNSIAQVEFYADGAKQCTDASVPYRCATTLASGSHSLHAVAVDDAGVTVSSNTATIRVMGN